MSFSKFYETEKSFLDLLPGGLEYQYPNQLLDIKPELFVKLSNIFGETMPLSLGPNGVNVSNNIFQIDIFHLKNRGMAVHLETLDKLASVFHIGKQVNNSIILKHEVGGLRDEGKHLILTLSVYYETQTNRGM